MQFSGKKGLIIGVANDRSLAWAIAKTIMENGGECGFTHLPDRPDDERQRNRRRVSKLTDKFEKTKFLVPMDAQKDEDIRSVFEKAGEEFGKIDFVLHSIAFADINDLKNDTIKTSREGFKMAMDISVYSLISCCRAASEIMNENGAIATMTYFGGEKCVPGYNVMGICKAALDATVRYMAFDMGAQKVRVNAISAGPVATLAGTGAGVKDMLKMYQHVTPMGENVSQTEVGKTGAFLLSDASRGISGEILHVDNGYHCMGSPGRLLDLLKDN